LGGGALQGKAQKEKDGNRDSFHEKLIGKLWNFGQNRNFGSFLR
jgi:hypothetical protein